MTKFDELIRLTLILNPGHINHGEKRQYYNENAYDIKIIIIIINKYVSEGLHMSQAPGPTKRKRIYK